MNDLPVRPNFEQLMLAQAQKQTKLLSDIRNIVGWLLFFVALFVFLDIFSAI